MGENVKPLKTGKFQKVNRFVTIESLFQLVIINCIDSPSIVDIMFRISCRSDTSFTKYEKFSENSALSENGQKWKKIIFISEDVKNVVKLLKFVVMVNYPSNRRLAMSLVR